MGLKFKQLDTGLKLDGLARTLKTPLEVLTGFKGGRERFFILTLLTNILTSGQKGAEA